MSDPMADYDDDMELYEQAELRKEELHDQQEARYDLYVEDCHNVGEAAMEFEEWEDML